MAAISSAAVRDGDKWVLNGTKIFCTSRLIAVEKSEGFVVVWATVDKAAGRAGIKAFVVDHHIPNMRVTKVEDKVGIRASDTAILAFKDCRIPGDNILVTPEVKQSTEGFKGALATFDAASAIGIGRADVDYVRGALDTEGISTRYDTAPSKLGALVRDFTDLEVNLQAARLLTLRGSWTIDRGIHNTLEARMAKAKAGLAATRVTQNAVEMLGPLGYSRKILLEKWVRDAKISDIFGGTQQISLLVIPRRILDYSTKELS